MLQTTIDRDTSEIIIRGEFFELDHIYFLIERLSGNYGIPHKHYLPEYENAAALLLGLNHEIRMAESGARSIHASHNGIHYGWIAPAGTPRDRIIGYEKLQEEEERFKDFDDIILFDVDMDPDKFYDLPEDEQTKLLEEADPFLDPDEIEAYVEWLNRDQTYFFHSDDHPGASMVNTYLEFRIPLAEGVLYACVLDTLLSMKAEIIKAGIQNARLENAAMLEYELDFSIRRLPQELASLEVLKEALFICAEPFCGRENYIALREKEAPKDFFKNLTENDIQDLTKVLKPACDAESGEDPVGNLEELFRLLFGERIMAEEKT